MSYFENKSFLVGIKAKQTGNSFSTNVKCELIVPQTSQAPMVREIHEIPHVPLYLRVTLDSLHRPFLKRLLSKHKMLGSVMVCNKWVSHCLLARRTTLLNFGFDYLQSKSETLQKYKCLYQQSVSKRNFMEQLKRTSIVRCINKYPSSIKQQHLYSLIPTIGRNISTGRICYINAIVTSQPYLSEDLLKITILNCVRNWQKL